MQIVIEKGIPVPQMKGRPKSEMTLIFEAMQPGDSFFVKMNRTKLHGQLSYMRRKNGFKFATRTIEDGVRVWRLA